MLIFEPRVGLCNRMRALRGIARFAEATGQRLVVVWLVAPELGASFADLFEPLKGIETWREFDVRTEAGRAEYARFIQESRVDRTIDMTEVGPLLHTGFRFTDLDPNKVTHVRSWFKIDPDDHSYADFKPKPHLKDRIDSIVTGFGKTIGVHIRRTDSQPSIRKSPTLQFIRRMRALLEQREAENFFVASDDPVEDRILLTLFPERIILQPKRSLDRSTSEAIEDAVVDLYCLAATKRVLGSHLSSFSGVAAAIGGIPQETVEEPKPAPTRPEPVITFGITLLTTTDPREQRFRDRMLSVTLASIYAQTDGAFRVLVCGARQPQVDFPIDDRVEFVRYDARPAVTHEQIDTDQGEKGEAIARRLAEHGGGYLMIVDMDDLVSNRLVEFVRANPHPNGYIIDKGYVWDVRSNKHAPVNGFHKQCGTSSIVYYASEDVGGRGSRFTTIRRRGHFMVAEFSIEAGRPLMQLPFRGAVWVHNHGGNLSYARDYQTGETLAYVNAHGVPATPLKAEFTLPEHYPLQEDYVGSKGRWNPSLSVCIITRGRPEGLRRLLAALTPQTHRRRGREIIVVNDGSHNDAYEAVRTEFARDIKYRALPENVGVAKARNASTELAEGDYLVFTDDDCVPPPGWLDWLQARLEWAPELDVVCGPTLPLPPERKTFFSGVVAGHHLLPTAMRIGGVTLFATANVAIRRSLFLKLGGFGFPGPFHGAAEDTELSVRLHRAGAAVALDGNWYVRHDSSTGLVATCRRYWRYGYANAMLSGLNTAPPTSEDRLAYRRGSHLGQWSREFQTELAQAAALSPRRGVRALSALAATAVRMAYLDGWAKALGERDRRLAHAG